MVSIDHSLAVASAEPDSRYFGVAAEPVTGSNAREYTGPLCPMSLRVGDPPFSRTELREEAVNR